jgi:hypothetical protein
MSLKNLVGLEVYINQSVSFCKYNGQKVNLTTGGWVSAGQSLQTSCYFNTEITEKAKVDFTVIFVKKGFSFPSSSDGVIVGMPSGN